MRTKDTIIAIFCSDIHLSSKPPIFRSAEPDWFAAMKRPLNELKELEKEYNCPIFCAGDVFDSWYSTPELINFAIESLPTMFSIPGQHDMPNHSYEEMKRSAYTTLVKAGIIQNLKSFDNSLCEHESDIMDVLGFPFGEEISKPKRKNKEINVAMAHEYHWIKGSAYYGAPPENDLASASPNKTKTWRGYNIIVFGDNHSGFMYKNSKGTIFFNCGSLMRRHSDQIDYKPMVGLLTEKGEMIPHYLDISEDKHIDKAIDKNEEDVIKGMEEFMKELSELGSSELDFNHAIKQYLIKHEVNKKTTSVIIKAMEG